MKHLKTYPEANANSHLATPWVYYTEEDNVVHYMPVDLESTGEIIKIVSSQPLPADLLIYRAIKQETEDWLVDTYGNECLNLRLDVDNPIHILEGSSGVIAEIAMKEDEVIVFADHYINVSEESLYDYDLRMWTSCMGEAYSDYNIYDNDHSNAYDSHLGITLSSVADLSVVANCDNVLNIYMYSFGC